MENDLTAERGLKPQQQAVFDEVLNWVHTRSHRLNAEPIPFKQTFKLPAGAEEWFDDNPDDYFVLKGYAGTGKTWTVAEIVIELSRLGLNIACCAPTNKAVSVIQEKVRNAAGARPLSVEFKSIHSACGLRMIENDDGELSMHDSGASTLHMFDIVLCDEASMNDLPIIRAIARARGECIVMFVGDPAQIIPVMDVSISRVFLLPQSRMLTDIIRQEEGNAIIEASMQIRLKSRIDEILAAQDEESRLEVIRSLGPEDRVSVSDLMEWLPGSMVKGVGRLRDMALAEQREGQDSRILCYTNKTVLANNDIIHFDLYPEARLKFVPGERLIVQSACEAEDIETGKQVKLVTSEEVILEYLEEMYHPVWCEVSCYQMVVKDLLGNSLLVYCPRLQSQVTNAVMDLFDKVKLAKDVLERASREKEYECKMRLNDARKTAWGFKKSFCELRHVYSMTVHKAQGSTFDNVYIDLPNMMSMPSVLEYNNALYTALTRPRFEAHIGY